MRALLDTHVFLWFILNDSRLSAPAGSRRYVIELRLRLSAQSTSAAPSFSADT